MMLPSWSYRYHDEQNEVTYISSLAVPMVLLPVQAPSVGPSVSRGKL